MGGMTIIESAAVVSRLDLIFLLCFCVYKWSLAGYLLTRWYWNICNDTVFCIACRSCISHFLRASLMYSSFSRISW